MKTQLEDFLMGTSTRAYSYFGAHKLKRGKNYIHRFRVFAPRAKAVELIGDFNSWEGSQHRLKKIEDIGVWQIEISGLRNNDKYKFNILTEKGSWVQKADPYAFFSELRPGSASLIFDDEDFVWEDEAWLKLRTKNYERALSIYEVHLGSWRRDWKEGRWLSANELIEQLVPYVLDNGYTHVEFLPLVEHPFDGSWGYQATGYYSPTSRYGSPTDLKKLINAFHKAGIGVILDVVPAHFVKDAHGLAEFDGSKVYEYETAYDAENQWGSLNFNLWDDRVRSFLLSSFAYWIKEFHFDGLRFDAISHLIYWCGNKNRGVNEGALDFMKRSNHILAKKFPTVMLIAEDSSDYAGVTKPSFENGLGFDYKWDLGWMNDTLKYFKLDPVYRPSCHSLLSFSMLYFYTERFLLPLSHDEVVHMKGSIMRKIWGTYEEKFAQGRLLMAYMYAHPGKKLNFMGNELASFDEWSEEGAADFQLLKYPVHSAYLRLFRDLNQIYKTHKAFYLNEYSPHNFRWIDADNAAQSVYSFIRKEGDETIVCVFNMQPVSYENFRIGVPEKGVYLELLNSEKDIYNGCNMCNFQSLHTKDENMHGWEQSLEIRLAPYAALYFIREADRTVRPKRRLNSPKIKKNKE